MLKKQLLELKSKNEQLAWSQMLDGCLFNSAMPVRVTIETTLKCNMKCIMCQVHRNSASKKKSNVENSDMPTRLFRKIVNETFSTSKVVCPTVMGEPFLTSFFPEFIQAVADYDAKMNMVTNGMLLDKSKIVAIVPHLLNLTVSFDGSNNKTFESIRQGSNYDRILRNITDFNSARKLIINEKPTLTFQVTLMRENIEELPDIIKIANELNVDRIVAFHMYAFDNELQKNSLMNYQDLTDENLTKAREMGEKFKIQLTLPRLFKSNRNEYAFDSNLISESVKGRRCKFLWSEVWISNNGDVTPCCVPNRPVMGNLYESSFIEIWNGEKYQRLRKGLVEDDPLDCCQNCAFASQYRGECEYSKKSFILGNYLEKNI